MFWQSFLTHAQLFHLALKLFFKFIFYFFTVSVFQERLKANDEYLLWWSYLACLNCCVINGSSLFQKVTTGQVYVCYVTDALTAYTDVS